MNAIDITADGTLESSDKRSFDPQTVPCISGTISIVGMPKRMPNGEPSVILQIPQHGQPDIFFETSLRIFCTASDALREYYVTHHGWKP